MADAPTELQPVEVNAVSWDLISSHFPEVLSASDPTLSALRRCDYCKRSSETEGENFRLRRCGGCMTSRYCSRDCQKADWVGHKSQCRSTKDFAGQPEMSEVGQELQSLGYSSFHAFAEALAQFVSAHAWALQACAKAFVLLSGGVDWSQNPQKMLYITLAPTSPPGGGRNPSQMFQFCEHRFINLEEKFAESPEIRADWEEHEPSRQACHEHYRVHPSCVGLLPILFKVEGVSITKAMDCPLFRRSHSVTIPEFTRRPTLEDMLDLCIGSINEGFPLCPFEYSSPLLAFPGQYVRYQGTWTWQPFFLDWSCYRQGAFKALDAIVSKWQVGVTPPELMFFFRTL